MRIGRRMMRAWRSKFWQIGFRQIGFRQIGTASVLCVIALAAGPTGAQAQQQQQPPAQTAPPPPAGPANAGPVQPWGLPPLPAGVGPVEKFADLGGTPQGRFLEGGAFDNDGNLWFVAIGSGWVSYLTPDGKVTPAFNCNPPDDIGQTCEPQGTRWHDGKLYVATRHRGILTYDPKTKEVKTLVYTYRNQLFKGPNDLDFDAEGNLFFTDPWATGPGPNMSDRSGAVYQYSKDGILRKIIDDLNFPNGIAVSPDNARMAIGDCTASRMVYAIFATGPTLSTPGAQPDPLHLTFQTVRAATYLPGSGCPDGLHYDVKGNLWIAAGGLGGILQVDPRGIIIGFVPIPNGDLSTTNFAFGGPDNRTIYFMGANSGTFWRFTAPYPGLIGPGGTRLPAQP
jgi:gluconolactonase